MERRILIVDDELDFSELLQYRLSDCGYRFITVTNSTDALNSAWDTPPDLILLDLLLPDLDGLSVCEIFTRHPATLNIPIIMISAVGTDVTRYSAQVAGAREFFSKPVDFEKLKTALTSIFNEHVATKQS
jgi:two-component system, OmpR family, phosphate regulon response regulator PhoB